MKRCTSSGLLLLALPGLAVPFLPFTYDVSPLQTILPGRWWGNVTLLGAPFFLAIPIAIWQARRLFASRLTSFEIVAAYVLSAGAMISVLWFIGILLSDEGFNTFRKVEPTVSIFACWLLVVANVALLWRNRFKPIAPEARAEVFLLGGYLPNAIFCLLAFGWGDWSRLQSGAWTAAIACVAYVVSIVLVLRSASTPKVYS